MSFGWIVSLVSGKQDLTDPKALANPTSELWISMTPRQACYTSPPQYGIPASEDVAAKT